MTIVEFLTARLDEDEAVAKAAGVGPRDKWHTIEWYDGQFENGLTVSVDVHGIAGTPITSRGILLRADGEHIARHDPAHVLAEVKAKRALIQLYATAKVALEASDGTVLAGATKLNLRAYGNVLRALAAPYDQHPDYDSAWRVA